MSVKAVGKYSEDIINAILSLETEEEVRCFFRDLCTINELDVMAQRFTVAQMLNDNKTYQEIAQATGASTATISRVSRALNFGENGYTIALKKLGK